MPETYDFKIGEKCICWWTYPYLVDISTIVRQTKQYWVLDNGYKFAKKGLNRAGFVGYAGTFIEPITEDSLKFVCTVQMIDAIKRAFYRSIDYDFARDLYETLINNTWEPRLPSVVLLDELLSSADGKLPDHVE
jgi:hypothetical protein